jgi:hypothetical protein
MRLNVLVALLFGATFYFSLGSTSEIFMYPFWNQTFFWVSILLCVSSIILSYYKKKKLSGFALIGSLVLGSFANKPFNEVDQLFYKQLEIIQSQNLAVSMSKRIDICEHVAEDYENLTSHMLLQLEKACSKAVLHLSMNSSQELNQAFSWAYSEYAKKPRDVQAETLACLYAETDQKEFAVQLSEKHQFEEMTGRLKTTGRCREFGNRQIASTKE